MIALLLILACSPRQPPCCCESHADCTGHEVCQYGGCWEPECTWRGDCGADEHCDATSLLCTPGCSMDADCLPGGTCEGGTCVDPVCEESWLDCPTGEWCTDPECEPEPGLCDLCDPEAAEPCGPDAICHDPQGDPSGQGYCLSLCQAGAEPCAAGFVCEERDPQPDLCFAHCPTLLDQGWL